MKLRICTYLSYLYDRQQHTVSLPDVLAHDMPPMFSFHFFALISLFPPNTHKSRLGPQVRNRIAVAVDEKTLRHGGHQLGWGLSGRLWWRSEPSGHWGRYPGRHLHLHQLRQRHRPTCLHDRIRLHVHLNPNTLSYDLCKVRVTQVMLWFDRSHEKAKSFYNYKVSYCGDLWLLIYRSVLSKWEFFIKMRAALLLSPSFITQGRMGARKAALILMKQSHFERTPQYTRNFDIDL